MRLLCWFGRHEWAYVGPADEWPHTFRICCECGRREVMEAGVGWVRSQKLERAKEESRG